MMNGIIKPERCVPFNFLLQGMEQCPEQHGISLENICICFFHPKAGICTAKDTKKLLFSIDSVT